ncbi:MAG: hypothetical protein PHN88_10555 [Ignavibacteria bacterium]|nr:hypothetical protein [Ignavibacteria bacterium]
MNKIFIFLIAVTFISGYAAAQEIVPAANKKPFLTIETSGSFDLPMMDLKGSNGIRGIWAFQDYGTNIGFGSMLNLKFAVYNTKSMQLRTYLTLGYSHFVNDDNRAFTSYAKDGTVSFGYPYTSLNGTQYPFVKDTAGVSNLRMNMPYLALGVELGVYTDRRNRSSFNFGLDYNFNAITGRIYQTIAGANETFTTYKFNLRNGIGANISYSYKFQDYLGFHVGTRFTMPNIFGKASEMSDESWYMFLMDKGNTTLNPALSSSRNMAYFKFYAGLSLFFGKM